MVQYKGQKEETRVFIESILHGQNEPIPLGEFFNTFLVTFKILESLRSGQSVAIS